MASTVKRKPTPKTGEAQRVLEAVKRGFSDTDAIAAHLGIKRDAVTNALARLVDGKKVRKDGRNRYVPNTAPALGETWNTSKPRRNI